MADRTQKGHILKKAREAKGITLEAVQDATKIPLDSLKAIEEGYRVRTLTDFYYRAFVKLYAKYLGVEVGSIIEGYKEEKVPQPTKFHKGKNFFREKDAPPFLKKQVIKNILKGLFVFIVLILCLRTVSCWFKSRPANPFKVPAKVQKKEVKKIVTVKPVDEKKSLNSQSESSVPSSIKRKSKKINLTIRTKRITWVSVRVDGVDRLRSTLAKGMVESWSASESIEISGKNLTDLEFELNGQPTNPSGKTHRSIKKIIITQGGFEVQN
ncbi:MAG: DUF4115 domain-containing protein [Candidatus Omnitrophica bacterium]|nr:DUF4115 domain-containing protein [Candidatus Omnitrophota bacterium]